MDPCVFFGFCWLVTTYFDFSQLKTGTLSILVRIHDHSEDVLVINRARLLRDTYFTVALNAMKHRNYPTLSTDRSFDFQMMCALSC